MRFRETTTASALNQVMYADRLLVTSVSDGTSGGDAAPSAWVRAAGTQRRAMDRSARSRTVAGRRGGAWVDAAAVWADAAAGWLDADGVRLGAGRVGRVGAGCGGGLGADPTAAGPRRATEGTAARRAAATVLTWTDDPPAGTSAMLRRLPSRASLGSASIAAARRASGCTSSHERSMRRGGCMHGRHACI